MKKMMQRMRMFKCFSMAALCLMGAATFVACSGDDDVVEPTPATPVATDKYTMTLTASKGNTTRGLMTGTKDGWNIIVTYWTVGETVDVVQNNTYLGTLTATPDPSDDTQATLTGTLEKAPTTGDYASNLVFYLHGCNRSYTGQVGTLADIAANHDYDWRSLAMYLFNVDEDNKTISSNYSVQFLNSMQNIVKFFLYEADGTTPIAAQSLTIHDGQNGLVQAWNNLTSTGSYGDVTINLSPATNEIYAALDFYKSPADLTLTAFDGTDYYTYTKDGVTAFNTTGKYFEIAVKMTRQPKTYNLDEASGDITLKDGDVLTGTLNGASKPYKISIAAGATVTLDGATINGYNSDNTQKWAGLTCLGDATIVLKDGTTNSVRGFHSNNSGIQPGPSGTTLTIRGSGSLTASSGNSGYSGNGAGIGGSDTVEGVVNFGNIVIEGGTIVAQGGNYAAGIGASYCGNCGDIEIGGTAHVTATGGLQAAGIGAGKGDDNGISTCGNIEIGGTATVIATGGQYGAGIGSGWYSECGNITIRSTVTSVTATKGSDAGNSIGAGVNGSAKSKCGTVTIEDGANVTQN